MNKNALSLLQGVWYLATTEGDQPRVRPFDGIAEVNGKTYFATTTDKKVYQQLLKNPKFEIFAMNHENGILRIAGEAIEEKDEELRKQAIDAIGKYEEAPLLAMFYMQNVSGTITGENGIPEQIQF